MRHHQYAAPGSPEGDPLPWAVWERMRVTEEEQEGVGIPISNRIVFHKHEAKPIPTIGDHSTSVGQGSGKRKRR